jgi:hypothetical protein
MVVFKMYRGVMTRSGTDLCYATLFVFRIGVVSMDLAKYIGI